MNDPHHARYLRLQHRPENRKQPTEIAWQQGYEAGWTNGRNVGLQPGPTDHVDPMRTLLLLETKLGDLTDVAQPLIDQLAQLIRQHTDDTTTWHNDAA